MVHPQKISNEFGNLQEILTDSVESAIERARIIVEYLSSETSDELIQHGIKGVSSISTKELEEHMKSMFKKTEEYLFVISECKHRITNLFAWLYKLAKKYEIKKDDVVDQPEPKKEDEFLANFQIDRGLLLRHLKSEDSFMIRYLSLYLKPGNMNISDLEKFELDYIQNRREKKEYRLADEDKEDLTVVRGQSEKVVVNIIDKFLLEMTGKGYENVGENLISMQEERADYIPHTYRSLHKSLKDSISAIQSSYNTCINTNISVRYTSDTNTYYSISRDIYTFAHLEEGIVLVYTYIHDETTYVVVVYTDERGDIDKIGIVCMESAHIIDLCVSNTQKIVYTCRYVDDTTMMLVVDMNTIQLHEAISHSSLDSTVLYMIQQKAFSRVEAECSKHILSSSYGYLHSNTKGLLSTSNGNNIIIVNLM